MVIGVVVVLFGFFTPYLIANYRMVILDFVGYADTDKSADALGTTGDWLGGTLTPVLTFAGNLLFISAILMQREELKLQRDELTATRNEFTNQNKTMQLQRFETTFFNMLSLHNNIVANIKSADRYNRHELKSGREAFGPIYDNFKIIYMDAENKFGKDNNAFGTLSTIEYAYQTFYQRNQSLVGHYFRNLYRIIKFVHETKFLNDNEKNNYCDIVRAQLSSYELVLLFYNGLSPQGAGFLPLIKTYDLLDGMDKGLLLRAS